MTQSANAVCRTITAFLFAIAQGGASYAAGDDFVDSHPAEGLVAHLAVFDWNLSEFATVTDGILTVEVPEDAPSGMYGATAKLDLAPYEGRSLGASIEAEAGPLSQARVSYHGLKFMFHFANTLSGIDCWPEARRPATPFARRRLEVSDTLSGGSRSASGTLFLGLQGVSGRIAFDLSTLEIVSGEIASRFLGRAGIYGYDLCNEPGQLFAADADYWTLQRLAAEAIRAIDPETPVIVESNNKDAPLAFSYLCPLDLVNVIYANACCWMASLAVISI